MAHGRDLLVPFHSVMKKEKIHLENQNILLFIFLQVSFTETPLSAFSDTKAFRVKVSDVEEKIPLKNKDSIKLSSS